MKTFYLQDSRSYLGNSMIWWGIEGQGYTTDLDKARQFTLEEAMAQHHIRETDIPWPVEYIKERSQCTVDMQYVLRSRLVEHGITLREPKPYKHPTHRCCHCGCFISEAQAYTMGCPKCEGDNRP